MLSMETVSKIRRQHIVDGVSIRELSRKFNFSRNTVRKYVRDGVSEPKYVQSTPRSSRRLIEHEVRLKNLYEADLQRPLRERRTMQGLYEQLVVDGYEGSYDTVRRYILRLKDKNVASKGYIPLAFDAGDALQFDWSQEFITLNGEDKKVYVGHFRLCHSRKSFVIAYFHESQEMVLDAFNKAFSFYNGVPNRVIIDNPKTMVLTVGKGKERVFHPRFLALMSHYAVEPIACTPASGWEKGQVERQVQTLRSQFFTPKLSFDNLEDLNTHLHLRCEALGAKSHPEDKTRNIDEVFQEEHQKLRAVGQAFDGYTERSVRVSHTSLVRFDTNSYSVPCEYVGSSLSLRAYAHKIVLCSRHQLVAEHPRCFERHKKFFSLWHYLPLLQHRPGGLRNGAPFKDWDIPKPLAMIWEHYRKQSGGDRDFVELLTLYQRHGHEAVEMACQLAIEYKTLQLSAIIALLHDLTEPSCPKEMAAETVSYPQLQLPLEANCHRYDQLLPSGEHAA